MKKLILKENGNFSIVSHAYVLYGRKHGTTAYVHLETPTCYMVDGVEWKDILSLTRERISWKEFISIVVADYYKM